VRALLTELRRNVADTPREIHADALELIGAYPWPGNLRELRNVLERALLLARGTSAALPQHLPLEVRGAGDELSLPHVSRTLAEVERAHIDRTLRAHAANRTRTARELGISRATLIKKIREYELGERPSAARRRENGGGGGA
jgi:transcriptional regulator with PAS, ATPase and Fis domain